MIKPEYVLFILAALSFLSECITHWGGFGIASYALLLAAYSADLYSRYKEEE